MGPFQRSRSRKYAPVRCSSCMRRTAADNNCSGGTISEAIPIASAAAESIDSPPVIISTALPNPTIRDARTVPPQPGNNPSFTSGNPNSVRSPLDRMRRSHQQANSAPPPTQMPSIAATVTNGQRESRAKSVWPRRLISTTLALGASSEATNSFKSAPAMKIPGLPELMINPDRSLRCSSASK